MKRDVFAALSAATLEWTQQIRMHAFIVMEQRQLPNHCVSSVRLCNKTHSYQNFGLIYSCSSLYFFGGRYLSCRKICIW